MDTLYLKANNKEMRRFKEDHARKNSKKNNLSDIYNRLMDKSDPHLLRISTPKLLANHRHEPLPQEVLEVLANPEDEILASQLNVDGEVDGDLEIDAGANDDDEDLAAYD
jgi:hypothetical protein